MLVNGERSVDLGSVTYCCPLWSLLFAGGWPAFTNTEKAPDPSSASGAGSIHSSCSSLATVPSGPAATPSLHARQAGSMMSERHTRASYGWQHGSATLLPESAGWEANKVTVTETIEKLLAVPIDYRDLGNVGLQELVRRSGYFEVHEQVTEEEIRRVLLQHPEYVNVWLTYSEDKRTSSGWYLLRESEQTYVVGYFEADVVVQDPQTHTVKVVGCRHRDRQTYVEGTAAGAAFIKREAEVLRRDRRDSPRE